MEKDIPATNLFGTPGKVTVWTDDSGPEGVRFCIRVDVGPYSVAYLDHASLVELIKEASQDARVVD